VPEVVVGELMGQHPSELVIIGLLEETGRDIEPSPTGAGCIDVRVVHDANPDLTQGSRVIHGRDEGGHDAADTLGLLWIEWVGRGLGPASLCGLRCAWRGVPYPGATRYQEKEQEGGATVRAHQAYRNTNVTISRATLVVKAHADHVLIAGPPGSLLRVDTSRITDG
jgi:hypothetical protein